MPILSRFDDLSKQLPRAGQIETFVVNYEFVALAQMEKNRGIVSPMRSSGWRKYRRHGLALREAFRDPDILFHRGGSDNEKLGREFQDRQSTALTRMKSVMHKADWNQFNPHDDGSETPARQSLTTIICR